MVPTRSGDIQRKGYILVESALTASQVRAGREEISRIADGRRCIQIPEVLDLKVIGEIFANGRIRERLEDIFGKDLVVLPSLQVQFNSITQSRNRRTSGLHIDAHAEAVAGTAYLAGAAPAWVNVGVYFQDYENGGEGGGVEIVPLSHRWLRYLLRLTGSGFLVRAALRLFKLAPGILIRPVRTAAGDAIIFDNRLVHGSYVPDMGKVSFSREGAAQSSLKNVKNDKIAVYFFVTGKALEDAVMENNFLFRARNSRYEGSDFDYGLACDFWQRHRDRLQFWS